MTGAVEHILQRHTMLRGIRVVDLTWLAAGPSGTLLLSMLGADVMRVESSLAADTYRKTADQSGRCNSLFEAINLGKRSIAVNLKSDQGRAIVLDLVRGSDVVVENFKPGTMKRLGLGYEALADVNQRLVMVSVSAAGHDGPQGGIGGYAAIFAAQAGLAHLTGYDDTGPGMYARALDVRIGVFAALGVLVGLLKRERTGHGCAVDLSAQEAVASLVGDILATAFADHRDIGPSGNTAPHHAGGGAYPARGDDQWVVIDVEDEDDWIALLTALGPGADTAIPGRLRADPVARWHERDKIESAVRDWVAARPADAVVAQLNAAGVKAGAVRDAPSLFQDAHLRARGLWSRTPQLRPDTRDSEIALGMPFRWSGGSAGLEPMARAPKLGEDTDTILAEIGYSPDDVRRLHASEVLT